MNDIVGRADIAFIVFDTLRYDVASTEFNSGHTPNLAKAFPAGWEKRHSPGSFTYAAHQAFFAGFLPTPADPASPRERLFATEFPGSETSGGRTKIFEASNIIEGFKRENYHTICIGGVGFFNRATALSCVLPDYFDESHWKIETGVTDPDSTRHQIAIAAERLSSLSQDQRVFFFLNISAIHQPNCHYVAGQIEDDLTSHTAALRYVDSCLPELFAMFTERSDTFVIACSDHGTLYGEEGFTGHRVGHEAVFTVPYMETLMKKIS